jgi:hypothetical protein
MSTDPKFKCSQCKTHKVSNEFGTRQVCGLHAQKGDRLNICLACSTLNLANRKRKRLTSNPEPPVKRCAMPPTLLPNQFVDALAEYASAPEIEDSFHVSLAGMTISGKDVANHITSLAWKATGYRFW